MGAAPDHHYDGRRLSKQIQGSRYLRLNVLFERDISLDNIDEIPYLVQLAGLEEINETKKWFNKYYA